MIKTQNRALGIMLLYDAVRKTSNPTRPARKLPSFHVAMEPSTVLTEKAILMRNAREPIYLGIPTTVPLTKVETNVTRVRSGASAVLWPATLGGTAGILALTGLVGRYGNVLFKAIPSLFHLAPEYNPFARQQDDLKPIVAVNMLPRLLPAWVVNAKMQGA